MINQRSLLLFFFCLANAAAGFGQKKVIFLEPEFMIGKNVANYKTFPKSGLRTTYVLNIGAYKNDGKRHDHRYYNFPHTGISIAYSNLGNNRALGKEISVMPYISINASKTLKHSWDFRFGLGGAYLTEYYDKETNPGNKAIGSRFNWAFKAFLYHTLWINSRYRLKLGGGYLHASNAHTQLPNFGLNSAMLSISCHYYLKKIDPKQRKEDPGPKQQSRFFQLRSGLGMHEFGSTVGPVGGPKKPVYSYALSYGLLLNRQLKLYSGFFYRYYKSYYDYLKENLAGEYQNIKREASNISFFIGCEYLLGHVGMNIEGGLNLYKPFYNEFYEMFETGDDFDEFRMSMFNTRMGLNLYLFNTNRQPKHNVALGGHVNANFGKADFGEISITYMKTFR